jgi:hypothetical protein
VERAEAIFRIRSSFETRIISAHRTPRAERNLRRKAEDNGIEVIIAAAGKAAHLGGVIAPIPRAKCRAAGKILHAGRAGFSAVNRSNAKGVPRRNGCH